MSEGYRWRKFMKANETKILNLIEGTKQFVVPLYQRLYSWKKEQWQSLWNDIADLYSESEDRQHFLGSIVTIPVKTKPEGVPKFLLIDGQQRLSTLFILLSALRHKVKDSNTKIYDQIGEQYLHNKFEEDSNIYKLLPTQKDRKEFFNIMKGELSPELGLVGQAYKYYSKRLNEKINEVEINYERLKTLLLNQIVIVSITLDENENPYLIFESLNYKGKELTQADLIRNYFFMKIDFNKQDEIYAKTWMPMQKQLEENLTVFVRHYLLKDNIKVREKEVYSTLKYYVDKKDDQSVIDYLKDIATHAEYYFKLLDPQNESNLEIREGIKNINRLDVKTAYPFLLNIYNNYSKGKFSAKEFELILKILENFIIRRFVCSISTNSYNKLFPSLYQLTLKETENLLRSGFADTFIESLKNVLTTKGYPRDREFKDKFKEVKLYESGGDRAKSRLILEKLESSFNPKEKIDYSEKSITIEHIIPQTINDTWKSYLGDDWENISHNYLDTIGNLTLTGYNAELARKPFVEKIKIYLEGNFQLNKYFSKTNTWYEDDIKERAEYLADKALNIWCSLKDINDGDVTKTKPVSLYICGQKMDVSTWKEVLLRTFEAVIQLDESVLHRLQNSNGKLLSLHEEGFISPKRLSNGYYIETTRNAKEIRERCLQAIRAVGLTETEWDVVVR